MTDGTYRWDPEVYTRNAEAQLSWARGLVSSYCAAWPPAEDEIVHVAMMRLEIDAVSG